MGSTGVPLGLAVLSHIQLRDGLYRQEQSQPASGGVNLKGQAVMGRSLPEVGGAIGGREADRPENL